MPKAQLMRFVKAVTAALLVCLIPSIAWTFNCLSNTAAGNWSAAGSWTSCNGTTPQSADTVAIRAGHVITLDTSPTISSVTIQNGGTLVFDGSNRTLTITATASTPFTLSFGGSFSANNGTVVFTGDANKTVFVGTPTFNNLSLTPTITNNRTWTMGTGTITVNGDFLMNATKASAGARILTLNMGAPIIVAGTTTITGTTNGRGLLNTVSGGNHAFTTGSLNLTANNTFTANNSTVTFTGTNGTLFTRAGTFNQGNSHVVFTGDGSATLTSGTVTFYKLSLTPTLTTNRTYTLNDAALTLNADFLILPDKPDAGNATLTVNMGQNVTVAATMPTTIGGTNNARSFLDTGANYAMNIGELVVGTNCTLKANGSTITLRSTNSPPFTMNGTFHEGTSTVIMNGDANLNPLLAGATSFYNLTLSPTITASRGYTLGAAELTVLNNLTIQPGTAANLLTVTMGAPITVGGTTSITRTTSATSLLDTTSSNHAFTTGVLNIVTGGTMNANDSTITLTGTSGTLFTETGVFLPGTSEVIMNPDADLTMTASGMTFYDLTLTPTITADRNWNVGTTSLTVLNNLSINPSAGSAAMLTVKMGAIIGVTSTVTVTGSGSASSTLNTGTSFALPCGNLYVDTPGTLTAYGSAITLRGTSGVLFTVFGNINASTAPVTVNLDTDIQIFNGTPSIGALSLTPTITTNRTYTLGGNHLTLNGNFNINPTAASAAILTVNMSSSVTVGAAYTTTISGTTNGTSHLDAGVGINGALTTGKVVIAAGSAYTARNSTITLTGTTSTLWTRAGTFNEGGSNVVITPNAAITLFSGAQNFFNLTISPTVTVSRAYTVGAGVTLNLAGNLIISPDAASVFATTVTLGAALTLTSEGSIIIAPTGSATGVLDTSTSNYPISAGYINIQAGGLLNGRSSQIVLSGTSGTLWTQTGSFATTASTVTFNPDTDVTLINGAVTFSKVVLAPTLTTDRTYEMGPDGQTINGNFTIAPDKPTDGTATLTVNMGAPITVGATFDTVISGSGNAYAVLDTGEDLNYTLSTGELDVLSQGTFEARAANLILTGTSGTLLVNAGGFNVGTSLVTITANGAVTINSGAVTFYDLMMSPVLSAARTYTFGADPVTVLHDLTFNPDAPVARLLTVNMGAPITVQGNTLLTRSNSATSLLSTTGSNWSFETGTLILDTGGTFNANGSTIAVNGTNSPLITRLGTFTQGTSTVTFKSAADTVLNSGTLTFNHLIIDTPNQTQTLGSAITVSGNLIVSNGNLDDGGQQITGNASNLLIVADGAELSLGSGSNPTVLPTLYPSNRMSFSTTSTVTYKADVDQLILSTPSAYGNLMLSAPSGTPTKRLAGNVTIAGNFTVSSNDALDVNTGNYNLTIGGNYVNDGSFIARAGTVTFNGNSSGITLTGNMTGSNAFNNLTFNGSGGDWTLIDPILVTSTLTVSAGTLLGDQNITVNGGVVGSGANGQINLSGGTFLQRIDADQYFGTNLSGSNDWTFNNLAFTNSSVSGRTIRTSNGGNGRVAVNGTFTIGDPSDVNTTTLNADQYDRFISVTGDVNITSKGAWSAASAMPITVGGNWTNNGTFSGNSSTVTWSGASAQYVNNSGGNFANLISSNTSFGGVIFTAGFSAERFFVNTTDLNSSATIYFAGKSTFTISTFSVTGTSAYPVVLRSTDTGVYWHLNNTSTNTVQYVSVQDSDASQGQRIFDYPGGVSLGHNLNWAMGAVTPTGLLFSDAQTTSLDLSWDASDAAPDSYVVDISTNSDHSAPVTSITTSLTNGTTSNLLVNTTYYARIKSTVGSLESAWSSTISTASRANIPASVISTWTVHFTSLTVTWAEGGNPSGTIYETWISSTAGFATQPIWVSTTVGTTSTFTALAHGRQYHAQVRAVNHSGVGTDWLNLNSTVTMSPQTPPNLSYTTAQPDSLSASWDEPTLPGETYTFQVSTDSNFGGTLVSSTTKNLFATTIDPLEPNTTYYGWVTSTNVGINSDWSAYVATATLAKSPASHSSTWSAVGYTSMTVHWVDNGNPIGLTRYTVEIATDVNYTSQEFHSSVTYNLHATFEDILLDTTYYAHVKATNHSGIHTDFLELGSTTTLAPTICSAVQSGNWDDPAVWSNCSGPSGLPLSTDLVTINTGVNVTLNMDATIAGIEFAAPAADNSLTQLSTVTLTVTGPVNFNQPTVDNRTSAWNLNGSTAVVAGLISFKGSNNTVSRVSKLVITSGQLNAFGGMLFTASTAPAKVIDMSGGAGRINLEGSLTTPANSSRLIAGSAGSSFNYMDDTNAQTVKYFYEGAYDNLYFNNMSGFGVTLDAAISAAGVAGDMRVQSGLFTNGGFEVTGASGKTFEVANGATFEMTGTSDFPTGFTSFSFGPTSRVRYRQTSTPLTINTHTYGHLDLMPAGLATQNLPAGAFTVYGDLTIGDGTNAAAISANANSTALAVHGDLDINLNASFTANANNPLLILGDWTNGGVFTHSNSTIAFTGASAQTVDNAGQNFAHLISSNSSSSGVVFASSFSATQLYVNTADLSAPATLYFAGTSTFTFTNFKVTGSAAYPVSLLSSQQGTAWHLNNTSTYTVRYVSVRDSDASAGIRILDYPGGSDLGGSTNWVFASNPPSNLQISEVFVSSFTYSWGAASPLPNSYTIEISTNQNFLAPVSAISTALTDGTTTGIIPNTTYYAQVKSVVEGLSSAWTSAVSTITLPNIPASAASTWTYVSFTTITVAWLNNSNPSNLTTYVVDLATDTEFTSEEFHSSTTANLSHMFENLLYDTTYYARVKAIGQTGFETDYLGLGSTTTLAPITCNATASGNWDVASRWANCTGPGGIPSPTDAITINAGVNITLNVDAEVAGLAFAAPGNNNSLTQLSTVTLTVNGNVVFNQPSTTPRTTGWNINDSTATVSGLISFLGASGAGTRRSQIVITSGQLNAYGGMSFTASASSQKMIIMSGGAGQLNLKGDLTIPSNSCTLTAGTAGSVFSYVDDVSPQTVQFFTAGAYHNLHLNNTSGSGVTLGAAVTSSNVTANLRIQSGIFNNAGLAIAGGTGDTFEVANGATFEMSGTSVFPTGYTTFTLGPSSRVRYLQTTDPLTIDLQPFGHLDLAPAGATAQIFPAGTFTIQGDLTVGNGSNTTVVTANINDTELIIGGSLNIASNGSFVANASNPLLLGGNLSNGGTFTHNDSTVSFTGTSPQTIYNAEQNFGYLISSNTSSGGLTFASKFSANQLYINTAELGAAATVYFAAGSTFTIPSLTAIGTPSLPVVLRSTDTGVYWHLDNASTHTVAYVEVEDSDASLGLRILDYPAGFDWGHNLNWAVGVNPPAALQFSDAQTSALTLAWTQADPYADTYQVQFSTNGSFAAPATLSSTALLNTTTSSLLLNTTYYARAKSIINSTEGDWSSDISTSTLANAPFSAASTWTAVNFTSVTVTWLDNGNPLNVTRYQVQLSTVSNFLSGTILNTFTTNLTTNFVSLIPATTYYAQVKAVNHSGIGTDWLVLGSTVTRVVNTPASLFFSSAATNWLAATWNATTPVADSYTLRVSTAQNFSGTIVSSNTTLLIATTTSNLSANTTYYGQISAVINGSTSPWSSDIATATLANVPASAASTWTAINFTSITVAWLDNGNPLNETLYQVRLSTVSNFLSGDIFNATSTALSATLDSLVPSATYHAQVKAVNHSGISTNWLTLGSTITRSVIQPTNLQITDVQISSISFSWAAASPAPDSYTLQTSTNNNFSNPAVSSSTTLLAGTTFNLLMNTTYFARVNSIIDGHASLWTPHITTVTLANTPASAASTWTAINFTSITIAWLNNSNPLSVTRYQVQMSTVSNFQSGLILNAFTTNLTTNFVSLIPDTTYHAQVKAINHSGISTDWLALGSTATLTANTPASLFFSSAGTNWLSARWDATLPPADSYTLWVSTAQNFTGTITSSGTALLIATTTSNLSVNTTYYGQINALINGSSSPWSSYVTTATLANAPVSAASTWSAVGYTSATIAWFGNNNPDFVTRYMVELSTVSGFGSGDIISSATYNLSSLIEPLDPGTTYYARVKATNHSGIDTPYVFLGSTGTIPSTLCNAVSSGNWDEPTVWSGCTGPGGIPSASDAITINSGVDVVLNVNAAISRLVFAAPGANNALTQLSTVTLTVNGPVTLMQPNTSDRNNTWNINAGSATVSGLITFNGTNETETRLSQIVITSGQLNAFGGFTFASSTAPAKVIRLSSSTANLNLKGNMTIPVNSCTLFAASGSVVNYMDSTIGQTVVFFTTGPYYHLNFNNTSEAGVTLGAVVNAANVRGDLRVQSGTFKNGGSGINGRSGTLFEVADNAVFEMSGSTSFPNGYSAYSLGSTSRVRYLQTLTPLAISTMTYGHLDLMPAGTATQNLPSGAFTVLGDLTVGDGTNAAAISADFNNTTLMVNGNLIVNNNATLTAGSTIPLTAKGNWSNSGTFVHNNSTIVFVGTNGQYVNNYGKAFANVISSNVSAGGVVFSSSFSAARLLVNTSGLGSSATLYFAAGSTCTISSFSVTGTSAFPVVLRSTTSGSYWYINNTSSHAVSYAAVQDSNANPGRRIFNYPGGADMGNNLNWAIGLVPPDTLGASASQTNSLTFSWSHSSPSGDIYNLQFSTNGGFTAPVTSTSTALLSGTTSNLLINTTYFAQVRTVIYNSTSAWSGIISTATLADIPASAASTWTAVQFTSVTVAWLSNGNPLNVTRYTVQLSTVGDFLSGTVHSTDTTNLSHSFTVLVPTSTYFAQVRAVNHSGIPTNWLPLGSTVTKTVNPPTGVDFSSVTHQQLAAIWIAPSPAPDSYVFQVSTASNFSGDIVSSNTTVLTATTTTPLSVNTTYYGRVTALINGSSSPWTSNITTATLANIPASAASTWTAVQFTSITVVWLENGNPSGQTRYTLQLSTVANFLSGTVHSTNTVNLSHNFSALVPSSTYYGRVRAVNHSNIYTDWVTLGSTATLTHSSPSNIVFTAVQPDSLSASWDSSVPEGNFYSFEVSTDSSFNGTLISSVTANLFATTADPLIPNTTYYGHASSILNGSTSSWSSDITTVTWANAPSAGSPTYPEVFFSSLTVSWSNNSNPLDVTQYIIELSTDSGFYSEVTTVKSTTSLEIQFTSLQPDTTYYAQAKAVNHQGVETGYANLGSTQTQTPTTCNAKATGNWSNPNTWINCTGPGGLPAVTDIITINSAITVTLNVDAVVGGLIFASPGTSNALTHSGANSLTVNGEVIFNQPGTNSQNNSWNINAGSATATGVITFAGNNTTTSRISRIVITTGELNAMGGFTFESSTAPSKQIVMSGGAGSLNLKGNLTIPANSCTLTAGVAGSIFNYMDDTNAQTVKYFTAGSYHNLHLNNTSAGGVTIESAVTSAKVTGNIRVQSGTFKNSGLAIAGAIGKTFEVADGGIFEMSGTSSFPSGFSTFSFGASGRVRYLQTSTPLTISAQTYGHLDLMPAGSATQNFPSGSISVQGDLSIGDGTNAATVNANANSTPLSVSGNINISPNSTFQANASNPLLLSGSWSNAGTFTHNSGTVSFNGSSAQFVFNKGQAFAYLISSNTSSSGLTFSSSFSATRLRINTSELSSGTTLYFAGNSTATLSSLSLFGSPGKNIVLKSTASGVAWHLNNSSTHTVSYVEAQDSNASQGLRILNQPGGVNLGNNINWDFGPPDRITVFSVVPSTYGASIDLSWTAPGEDGVAGTLYNSTFTIQYSTDTDFAQGNEWNPSVDPYAHVFSVHITTNNVNPGSTQSRTLTDLISGGTYYFRIWTIDADGNFSDISVGATNYAQPISLGLTLSTNTLTLTGTINLNTTLVISTGIVVTNSGNVTETFEFAATTATPGSPWHIGSSTATDQFVLWAIANDTEPASTDFGSNDKLLDSYTRCTASVISNGGSTCVSVPIGESRTIWFKLGMPNLTTTADTQQIRITGKATVPD
ncbi:MAG: hypothetical protein KCHDKBKB_01215 [Elusimicrobia bacterium]|nr:hypothetical protein [Elusimicrobiota bacterium]